MPMIRDSGPFIKDLPSQHPCLAPGGGEKQWPTSRGCRGPGQTGGAHLPAEGRAGLSSEKLVLTLAGPLRPPLVPGLEGPQCLGLPMSKCSRPSEGPWGCPTPSIPVLCSRPQREMWGIGGPAMSSSSLSKG